MYRTIEEQREITLEAERRVRAGESRAEIARDLNIPLSTLATWAHRGGWRRKDIIAVRDAERGKLMLAVIEEVTAAEREKAHADAAKLLAALEASKAEASAVSGQIPGATAEGPAPAQKLAMALADSLLRQGELEEADRAVRLAIRFAAAEQAASTREETRLQEERERLQKWWSEKQAAYHTLHAATLCALDEINTSLQLQDSRSADQCCPSCGRRMDFWPEEVERPDGLDGEESGAGQSGDDDDFCLEPATSHEAV